MEENMLEDLKCVDTKQASEILGVSHNTLNAWRSQSTPNNPRGPKWVMIETAIRYRVSDLDKYLQERTRGDK